MKNKHNSNFPTDSTPQVCQEDQEWAAENKKFKSMNKIKCNSNTSNSVHLKLRTNSLFSLSEEITTRI